jgi:hypothetical protein
MIADIDYDEPQGFCCVGGPWDGRLILLGDDGATMVFSVRPARKQWRGRYTTRKPGDKRLPRFGTLPIPAGTCRWQDVA